MKGFLRLRSLSIPKERDICDLVPTKEFENYLDSLALSIQRIDDEMDFSCNPYSAVDSLPSVTPEDLKYAENMHISPNHACYDKPGSTHKHNMNGTCTVTSFDNQVTSVINQTITLLVDAMCAKGHITNKFLYNDVMGLFITLSKYWYCNFPGLQGILCVKVPSSKRNYRYKLLVVVDDAHRVNPSIISDIDSCGWKCSSISFVTNDEVAKLMKDYKCQMGFDSDTDVDILEWGFGFVVEYDHPTLIFSHYKTESQDTATVEVFTSNHLDTNIATDIKMIVHKNKAFEFIVYNTSEKFAFSGLVVNNHTYTLSSYDLAKLCNRGIDMIRLENPNMYTTNGYTYIIRIKSVVEDMTINAVESRITPYEINKSVFTLKEEIKLVTDVRDGLDSLLGSIFFEFGGDTKLLRGDIVTAYAVPMSKYNHEVSDDWDELDSSVIESSRGFGQSPFYQLNFSAPTGLVYDNKLLVRVVFPKCSMGASIFKSNTYTQEFLTDGFAGQFELDIENNAILSISQVFGDGYGETFNRPVTVISNMVKLSNVDAYPYFELLRDKEDGTYRLIKNELFDGIVPSGIPESSIYHAVQYYHNVIDTDIDDKFVKFVSFAIPLGMFLNDGHKYNIGETVTIPNLLVSSNVNAAFNIDCAGYGLVTGQYGASGNVIDAVSYIKAKRPYLNGYVDIPVLFISDKDVVSENPIISILIPDYNAEFNITVELWDEEGDNIEVPDENPDENPVEPPVDDTYIEDPSDNQTDETNVPSDEYTEEPSPDTSTDDPVDDTPTEEPVVEVPVETSTEEPNKSTEEVSGDIETP